MIASNRIGAWVLSLPCELWADCSSLRLNLGGIGPVWVRFAAVVGAVELLELVLAVQGECGRIQRARRRGPAEQVEQGELVVFDPRNASNFKTYNSDDLGRMLNKVQVELRRIEPTTRIRRILRSVESAILLLSLKRRRRDFDEFKYRAALERIEDLQLPTELRKRINLIKKECGVQ